MSKDKVLISFKHEDVDYDIVRPTVEQEEDAQAVYNRTFSKAVKNGAFLRQEIVSLMKEKGLWNDEKQREQDELRDKILAAEKRLHDGGFSAKEADKLAFEIQKWRDELFRLNAEYNSMDNSTAETQAEGRRRKCLLAHCLVYNDSGKPVFKSYEDYLSAGGKDTILTFTAERKLIEYTYNIDEDFEGSFIENRYLKQRGLVDEKYRRLNEEGKLVDDEGRLIDEEGRYVNEEGQHVNKLGALVDDEGKLVGETKPFLDDDGNEITLTI